MLSRRAFLAGTAAVATTAALLPPVVAPASEFAFEIDTISGLKVDRIVWSIPHGPGKAFATIFFKGPGNMDGSFSTDDDKVVAEMEEHRRADHSLTIEVRPIQTGIDFVVEDEDYVEESGY